MMKNRFFCFKALVVLTIGITFGGCSKNDYNIVDGFAKPNTTAPTGEVDTDMKIVDRSLIDRARVFPGLVSDAEPRLNDKDVTLNMNFSAQTRETLRIAVAPIPLFSTGLYAAPGELVKVVVPQGIDGLTILIGLHTTDLSGKSPLLRDPAISVQKQLYAGVNYVRNLYGGNIYILATRSYGPDNTSTPVTFKFSNVCATADFVLGETTDIAAWKSRVTASGVPWLEFRSKRVIFTVPTNLLVARLQKISDPVALMTAWNNIFETHYNQWMGLSDDAADPRDRSPQSAWRATLDIQMPTSTAEAVAGFPILGLLNYGGNVLLDTWIDVNQFTANPPVSSYVSYHEFGHNVQQHTTWSWSTMSETTNNLFQFKIAKALNQDFKNLIPKYFAIPTGTEMFYDALNWVQTPGAKNLETKFPGTEGLYIPRAKMTPFLQLMEVYNRKQNENFDYGIITYLYKQARYAPRLSASDDAKRDFFFQRVCEYTGLNLMPFFYQWGIPITSVTQGEIAAKYPTLDKEIWKYNFLEKTGGTSNINFDAFKSATASSTATTTPASETFAPNKLTDNTTTTYWQALPTNSFPFTLTLDAQFVRPVSGLSFVQSTVATARVKDIEILASSNNTAFTSVGTFQIPNNTTKFNVNFSAPINARYFRVVLKNNWSNTQAATLAELATIQ